MREAQDAVSPDSLMKSFQGRGLIGILLVTVVVHVVVIFGTSGGYLMNEVFGTDTSEMSKEDRVKVAIGEATSALGEIAKRHNLVVEDITERFASGGSRAGKLAEEEKAGAAEALKTPAKAPAKGAAPDAAGKDEPEREMSEFEKDLKKPVKGPEAPGDDIDEDMGL